MVHANGIIPPTVALPPQAGGRGSLNLFVALTGPSGAGKGTSESVARDAIRFCWRDGQPADLPTFPLGSGEGIARTFMAPPRSKGDTAEREQVISAIFSVPEIDTAAALFARSGSTLESELRKVFSGEQLGFTNAQNHTRTLVEAHTYRAGGLFGVQPGRASVLLDGAAGGTPQRLVWLPVLDAAMPDQRPDEPAPITIRQPRFDGDLAVPDVARDAIDAHQLAMHRGEVDPLDGHQLLVRLKVAAALMILDGRAETPTIIEEDWHLAGAVMTTSDETRRWVQRERADAARRSNHGRALATAERDEVIAERKLSRAKQGILRWLARTGEIPARELRPRLKADIRADFDAAVAELADEGQIVVIDVPPNGKRYRLNTEVHAVPEVQPPNLQIRGAVPDAHAVPPATVTDLDTRRPHESDDSRLPAHAWLDRHLKSLRADGQTTVSSFAVYSAAEAAGYKRTSIAQAAHVHPEVVVIDRAGITATWSIAGQTEPYTTAAEWVSKYLDRLPDGTTEVDQSAIRTAAAAAGYSWEATRRAARRSGRINSVPAHGNAKVDRRWLLVDTTAEDAS